MNLFRQTTQRLTAALAILAVLLLFVAPVISKNLTLPIMMPEMVMTQADHDMAMSQHNSGDHAEMKDHSNMSANGMACGYCDLLVHVPLLLFLFIPFIWLSQLLLHAPPVRRLTAPVLRPIHHIWHSRAPPFVYSTTCYLA